MYGGDVLNKRSIPIAVISCVLILAGIAGYLMPGPTEAVPPRILMENAGGRVVFTHQAHSTPGGAYGDISCAACHHDMNIAPASAEEGAPASVMKCTACHGTADIPGFADSHQEFYMEKGGQDSCASCHHPVVTGVSPKWSHEDHLSYAQEDCESCHHPVRYEVSPGKMRTIKPQKCSNCHTAKPNPMTATTLKNATHAKCESCHAEWFEQKQQGCANCHTQDDASYQSCNTCHGPMLGRMDAFHGNCMSCHKSLDKGPYKENECRQCHTP